MNFLTGMILFQWILLTGFYHVQSSILHAKELLSPEHGPSAITSSAAVGSLSMYLQFVYLCFVS